LCPPLNPSKIRCRFYRSGRREISCLLQLTFGRGANPDILYFSRKKKKIENEEGKNKNTRKEIQKQNPPLLEVYALYYLLNPHQASPNTNLANETGGHETGGESASATAKATAAATEQLIRMFMWDCNQWYKTVAFHPANVSHGWLGQRCFILPGGFRVKHKHERLGKANVCRTLDGNFPAKHAVQTDS
jgi:hypothetical protein